MSLAETEFLIEFDAKSMRDHLTLANSVLYSSMPYEADVGQMNGCCS